MNAGRDSGRFVRIRVDQLDRYNVVWTSPSAGPNGSMPLGDGRFGINVWAEPSGDVLVLLGHTDAWDETCNLLKLGRLRIRLSPVAIKPFRQELHVAGNQTIIDLGESRITFSMPIGAATLDVRVENPSPVSVSVTAEVWRNADRVIKTQTGDLFKRLDGPNPYPTVISPDEVLQHDHALIWCHHNRPRENDAYTINMKLQGLGGCLDRAPHPLTGHTFGAMVAGDGFEKTGELTLVASPATQHSLQVVAHVEHPSTIEGWRSAILGGRSSRRAEGTETRENSYIHLGGHESSIRVSRAYALQSFMNRAAGLGSQPAKFNGSIFSVGQPDDPDYRRWGPGYWFQNMRLIYWPMLAAGQFDLMLPFFRMYRDQLELQKHRTQTYYRHPGAHYPETSYFWGAEVSAHYGWTAFEDRARPEAECSYVTYYWSGGIELSLMMCEYYAYTLDESFAREFLLPVAREVIAFYDHHYPRDGSGRRFISPSQALETWQDCDNPTPEIAGLSYTIGRLLELPGSLLDADLRAQWTALRDQLPPLPLGDSPWGTVIKPAGRADKKKNTENPELYAIFPYRLYGIGKPDLDLAKRTFAARLHACDYCWHQDDIQMALLGLTEQAKANLIQRAAPAAHSDSRFPAFWNAFHDWIPDMDHGGVLQLALQLMLMQCDGRQIRLLPAWPAEWEADFRLHAPYRTIVEGKVRGGEVVDLIVTPESRRADIVL